MLLVGLVLFSFLVVGSNLHLTLALTTRLTLPANPFLVAVGAGSLVSLTVTFAFGFTDSRVAFRVRAVVVFERPRHGYSEPAMIVVRRATVS